MRADRKTRLIIPNVLNSTARIGGWPIVEFFLLLMVCVVLLQASPYTLFVSIPGVIILGRVRKLKPVNWFTFLPYLWLKVRYPYLLPPGKKKFLP